MESLKPCPFCGGNATIEMTSAGHGGAETDFSATYAVSCKNCGAKLGRQYRSQFSLVKGEVVFLKNGYADAVCDWNKRVPFKEGGQD